MCENGIQYIFLTYLTIFLICPDGYFLYKCIFIFIYIYIVLDLAITLIWCIYILPLHVAVKLICFTIGF